MYKVTKVHQNTPRQPHGPELLSPPRPTAHYKENKGGAEKTTERTKEKPNKTHAKEKQGRQVSPRTTKGQKERIGVPHKPSEPELIALLR
ncbi:MAG: hypothetical protein MI923_24905, partial [Phycisphaerales bacterium]|nr:hypothetical protein [Phycisphaerales bacterium]